MSENDMAIANAAVVGGDEVKVAASPRAVEAGDDAETPPP